MGWFDGIDFGIFPVEDDGLPHAQISDVEVKETPNGYELWMSCLSRGIAVLNAITNPVGIAQEKRTEPAIYFQNYPNPCTDKSSFSFSLPQTESVNLSIYNITGELVTVLVNKQIAQGKWDIAWNVSDQQNSRVSPGIYIARLLTKSSSKTIKIVVN